MQILYATRYRCDACGAQADIPPGSDPMAKRSIPDGWASEFRFEHWTSGVSYPVNDLCASCASMSILDLITMLKAKREAVRLWAGC